MKVKTKLISGVIVISSVIGLAFFFIFLPMSQPISERKVQSTQSAPPTTSGDISPSPSPSPSDDRLSAIDQIIKKLDFGNIAFNAPKSINIHDTAIIQLMLGLKKSVDDLEQMIEAAGEKQGARIRVSDRMEARLSGPNFTITTITTEIQAISRNNITEWKWAVKPSSDGRHYLHLTLSALLSINGTSTP